MLKEGRRVEVCAADNVILLGACYGLSRCHGNYFQ